MTKAIEPYIISKLNINSIAMFAKYTIHQGPSYSEFVKYYIPDLIKFNATEISGTAISGIS